jgi:transcriptional regulator with XRE-family HTH domain
MDEINPRYLELSIIRAWLKGGTRDEIADEFGKSRGTVSNITTKMRNEWGNYDAESMRVLAKELREQAITADNCACGFRIFNILEKLKIPEAEIENFLETMYGFSQKMDIKVDIFKDALLQFVKLSDESPFSDISKYLHEKNEEIKQLKNKKQKLKEEIQTIVKEKIAYEEKVRSSLKNARTTLVNIDIFVNTRDELESYGIHVEDIDKFARCLQGI